MGRLSPPASGRDVPRVKHVQCSEHISLRTKVRTPSGVERVSGSRHVDTSCPPWPLTSYANGAGAENAFASPFHVREARRYTRMRYTRGMCARSKSS